MMMASDITEMIDMLFDMINEAKNVPLSGDKCMIERDRALDLIDDIRNRFPMELKEARKIMDNRADMLATAKREAEAIRQSAEDKARQLLAEDVIALQAKQRANEMIRQSEERSRELKRAAYEYCEDTLRRTEEAVAEAYDEIKKSRGRFCATAGGTSVPPSSSAGSRPMYDVAADMEKKIRRKKDRSHGSGPFIYLYRERALQPFHHIDPDVTALHIGFSDKLGNSGNHDFPLTTPDHIDVAGRQGANIGNGAQYRAGLGVSRLQSVDVGQEEAALGQVGVLAVDIEDGVLHGEGTVHISEALQLENDHILMDTGPLHLDGEVRLIHIEGLELAQVLRGVSPGLHSDLAHDAMDIGDLTDLQILLHHMGNVSFQTTKAQESCAFVQSTISTQTRFPDRWATERIRTRISLAIRP